MTQLNFADAATQDVRGTLQHLKASGSASIWVERGAQALGSMRLTLPRSPRIDAARGWAPDPRRSHG